MAVSRVAVVGGGIAGLSAALRLRDRLGDTADILLLEQGARPGGKLRTGSLAGLTVELGAETFLMRDPEGAPSAAVRLVERLGLSGALVHPAGVPAAIAVDGQLLPLPGGTLMGVPAAAGPVGSVAVAEQRDVDSGAALLAPGEDVAVGALVRQRFGDAVVDRLVDPLLGGVYAGRADRLSLAVTIPALARAARTEHTLSAAVRTAQAARGTVAGPVFGSLEGGLSRLVDALLAELAGPSAGGLAGSLGRGGSAGSVGTAGNEARAGVSVLAGTTVREVVRTATGWRLVTGPTTEPVVVEVDAVVLAVPGRPAARLLRESCPAAAAEIGVLDYASVGLVSLALPETVLPKLSGFLVPATEGRLVKAMTNFTTKWCRDAAGRDGEPFTLLRASVGRFGDEESLQREDAELAAAVHAELALLLGIDLPAPVEFRVTRWGGGLPQYGPGHLARVARARAAVPASLALAGAGYDGVGIPACVGSGEAAAEQVIAVLDAATSGVETLEGQRE
jgi:oxygen-dependent protoporphyrinogen oxidase